MRRSTALEPSSLRTLVLAAALLISSAAGAADEPAGPAASGQEGPEPLEEVVVTGSLIKRPQVGSQLVTAITAEEIARRGATNATEILRAISQNQPLEVPNSFTGAGTALASYASLRSLGSEDTLVLIGGRRAVNNPYQNKAVDLNTVPVALIERVDVLSDGASSIYGSDAIAGVINFITREEFRGMQVSGTTFQPQESGGESYSASATAGFGSLADSGWNFYVGGTYRERKLVTMLQRDFSDSSYFPEAGVDRTNFDTFPMSVFQYDEANDETLIDTFNFLYPVCAPPRSIPVDGYCVNDNAAENALQNPEKQWSIVSKLTGRLGDSTASLEYFRAQSTVVSEISSNQLDGFLETDNPYYPGNGITPLIAPPFDPTLPLEAFGRFPAAGPRSSDSRSYTDRLLGELKGDVLGIDYELWALRSKSQVKLRATGRGILYVAGVNATYAGADEDGNPVPYLNPFGDQTPQFMDYLETIQFKGTLQTATGELKMAGLQLSKGLFELPGGRLSAALGLEYGSEDLSFENAAVISQELLQGFSAPGEDVKADRDRYSLTAEVLIPVLPRVELDISARRDHYDGFGSTVNPKILATWRAIPDRLNLHASYNTGFRAPTLYELYRPRELGFTLANTLNDPVLCPNGHVNEEAGGEEILDCTTNFTTLNGANPDLEPIESKAHAIGFDFTPIKGLSVGLDYWSYVVDKSVGVLADTSIFDDVERFGSYIVRCSQAEPIFRTPDDTGCDPDGTGHNRGGDPIAYILQNLTNIGKTRTDGFDLGLNWAKDVRLGTLSVDYQGSYVNKYEFQEFPGDRFIRKAGVYIGPSPIMRYSHFTAFSWDRGAWGAQLQNRYQDGYIDFNGGHPYRKDRYYHEVGHYSLWDLSASYRHGDAWTVTALVKNLFNTDPPFTNKTAGTGTGFDERYTDPIGRAFGLTVTANFGGR